MDTDEFLHTAERELELEAQLRRAMIVRDNLAQRVGALIAENLDLMVRLAEQDEQP
jgi:hypothetical protein